jgi:F0F1-type ATP synthase membrane subunit b/b'
VVILVVGIIKKEELMMKIEQELKEAQQKLKRIREEHYKLIEDAKKIIDSSRDNLIAQEAIVDYLKGLVATTEEEISTEKE